MDYNCFIRLRNDEQAFHTLTNGTYLGTNEEGDDIYQLNNFWVGVRENSKGFYYEPITTKPNYLESQVMNVR